METSEMSMSEQCSAPVPSASQIAFEPAMQDFKAMFPEMDEDVIEEVLRANGGGVDATIDQLLSMTIDNMNEALRLDLEKSDQERMGNHSKSESFSCHTNNTQDSNTNGGPSRVVQKWFPPLLGPLPPTFLRLEPKLYPGSEDESIALFLQNEEFLSELRTNEEFMNSLEEDGVDGGVVSHDLEAFKKRLRSMGKRSRKKFHQLSRVFRHKRNRSAKKILDQSACGDSRLLSGEPLLLENFDDSVHK